MTLDLCRPSFPSEGFRVARLQVVYAKPGSAQELSNEVVRYRPGGAQQALREVTRAATHCPRGPIQSPIAGVSSATWRITRITDPRLLPGYLAVRIHLTEVYKGKKVVTSGLGVYQVKSDVLSGVYTNGSSITAAQQRLALHAAEQGAGNLREFA